MAKGGGRFDRWRRPGEDTEVIPAVKDDEEEVTGEIPVQRDEVDDRDATPRANSSPTSSQSTPTPTSSRKPTTISCRASVSTPVKERRS